MKILFLDVDNVICTPRYNLVAENQWQDLDPVACNIITRICEETECLIVLSSSWGRGDWTYERFLNSIGKACPELTRWFHQNDFRLLKNNNTNETRSESIAKWLERHPEVEAYAILDDVGSYGHCIEEVDEHLVLCDENTGVGFEEYLDVCKLLRG